MKKEMLRKNNGITLITIAITIIILLILSSITITIMTGDDGLARRAEKTKQSSDDNVLIETLQIEIANCYDEHGNLDIKKAKDVLEKSKTFDVGKYNKDLIVNYGESGRREVFWGYTTEVSIQFLAANTNDVICVTTAEGFGDTEADDIKIAINRALDAVFQ